MTPEQRERFIELWNSDKHPWRIAALMGWSRVQVMNALEDMQAEGVKLRHKTFGQTVQLDDTTRVDASLVVHLVAARFRVTPEEIRGERRTRPLPAARRVACKVMHEQGLSLRQIALLVGYANYSSVIEALRVIKRDEVEAAQAISTQRRAA